MNTLKYNRNGNEVQLPSNEVELYNMEPWTFIQLTKRRAWKGVVSMSDDSTRDIKKKSKM